MNYFQLRQRFLKVLDSYVGDLRAAEVQLSEVGRALQMHQPDVANARGVFEAIATLACVTLGERFRRQPSPVTPRKTAFGTRVQRKTARRE
jgi:hypothetical protein